MRTPNTGEPVVIDACVLAAAIKAKAARILTFNPDDFAPEALAPWGGTAVHPQDYLLELYAKDARSVTTALDAQAQKKKVRVEARLALMQREVPKFVAKLLSDMGTR